MGAGALALDFHEESGMRVKRAESAEHVRGEIGAGKRLEQAIVGNAVESLFPIEKDEDEFGGSAFAYFQEASNNVDGLCCAAFFAETVLSNVEERV